MRIYHTLAPILVVAFSFTPPGFAQSDAGLVAHWRFSPEHLQDGQLQSLAGPWTLRHNGPAQFFGPSGQEALMLTPTAPLLVATTGDQGPTSTITDPATLPQEHLSIEAWIAIDEAKAWGGFLSAVEDQGDYERGWVLGYKGNKFLFGVATEDVGRLTYLKSDRPFRPGRWYHLVGTYNGKELELYVDGKRSANSSAPGGNILYHDSQQLVAGAFKDRNEDYRLIGSLFEVRLFERAMNRSEVGKRYRKNKDRLPEIEGRTVNLGMGPASISEMQGNINHAIDRGVEYLLLHQHRDGSWSQSIDAYPNGITSLALYTLVKSGVPKDHPAVLRALDYLRMQMPVKTYSAGLQLLAMSSLAKDKPDKELKAWAEEVTWALLEMENKSQPGIWAYPGGRPDLSNTQFAALGFWAAWQMGIDVPVDVWRRMVSATCEDYQSDLEDLEFEAVNGRYGGKRKVGGFTYYKNGTTSNATGSMATAGLCILSLAQKCTNGKLGRRYKNMAKQSIDYGLN